MSNIKVLRRRPSQGGTFHPPVQPLTPKELADALRKSPSVPPVKYPPPHAGVPEYPPALFGFITPHRWPQVGEQIWVKLNGAWQNDVIAGIIVSLTNPKKEWYIATSVSGFKLFYGGPHRDCDGTLSLNGYTFTWKFRDDQDD